MAVKPKVELEVFCAEFYNSMVFHPAVSLKKDAPLVWDSALKPVQDDDYAIAQVEQED